RYQDNNRNINSKISFDEDFSLVLTRENVQNIKPHPEVYLKVLEHFEIEAKDCLIIEDSLIGVEAANHAGIEVVASYDQNSDHEIDLIKAKAIYYVEEFSELLSLIQYKHPLKNMPRYILIHDILNTICGLKILLPIWLFYQLTQNPPDFRFSHRLRNPPYL